MHAETSNGYRWVDKPGSVVMGDQAEHRRNVGPGGKRKRAESECPVRVVGLSADSAQYSCLPDCCNDLVRQCSMVVNNLDGVHVENGCVMLAAVQWVTHMLQI